VASRPIKRVVVAIRRRFSGLLPYKGFPPEQEQTTLSLLSILQHAHIVVFLINFFSFLVDLYSFQSPPCFHISPSSLSAWENGTLYGKHRAMKS
jgi:hypothetical protein